MKKLIVIALTIGALAFSSCSRSAADESENICLGVLGNTKRMYDPDSEAEIYLNDYTAEHGVSASEYTVIDLNGDGEPETVVGLTIGSDAYGFLILHADKGTAYAYELPYRAFTDLKEDGTFSFSSGAADSGIGRLDFADGWYSVEKLAYSESGDDIQDVSYYIGGAEATEDEFYALLAEQNKKPGAEWHVTARSN